MSHFFPLGWSALALLALAWAGRAAGAEAPIAARKALDAGEPQRAVEVLEAAVRGRPADARLRAELALALLAAGAHDAALEAASAATSAAPEDPSAARALGLVRAGRHEWREALRVLDASLLRHPRDAGLLAARGRSLWQLGRTRSAVQALEEAAKDPETAGEAQYWLGRIFFFKGWEAEGAFPGWHEEAEYRQKALAAFGASAAARPAWYEPRLGLGEALLRAGRAADALARFDEALARGPNVVAARVGRWKALEALGRAGTIEPEVAAAAGASDPRLLGAARQGYEILGRQAEADRVAERLLDAHASSAAAEAVGAARIQATRASRQYASLLEQARAFEERFPFSPRLLAVYDALLEAYQATPSAPVEAVAAAIDARLKIRPDPGAYMAGAALLIGRGALLDRAIQLAEDAVPAAEAFVNENLGSYKLADKARGSLNRVRAGAADLVGWASLLKGDIETAAARLAEAERLSRGQDLSNQFHLGELARTRGALEEARERYTNALSLSLGPEGLRAAARKALADVHGRLGNDPGGFEAWAQAELDRRRQQRRAQAVRSMVDRPAPPLKLTDMSGRTLDLLALRGKVLLLNFFASW